MINILLNGYVAQNLGDDLFIKYICNRYKNLMFYLCCEKTFFATFKEIKNLNLISSIEEINNVDLQILIGGSVFMQSRTRNISEKYKSDSALRFSKQIPFIVLGANFGPYTSEEFPKQYEDYFKSTALTVFRDEYSYRLFPYPNIYWAPDILLNYPLPTVKKQKTVTISCIKKNLRTGIPDYDEEAYFEKIREIAEQYVSNGYKILLAAFCKKQEDDKAADIIFAGLTSLAKSNTSILIYEGDTSDFFAEFLASSYIIGTRFHSVILGWNANIPVFPIEYNSKMTNAIKSYGFNGSHSFISEFCNLNFEFINSNLCSQKGINENIRVAAENHFLLVDKFLKENNFA